MTVRTTTAYEDQLIWQQVTSLTENEGCKFVPPLVGRKSRFGSHFKRSPDMIYTVNDYINDMINQKLVIDERNGHLHGFISYVDHRDCSSVKTPDAIYISTVIIDPMYRRCGSARSMYNEIISIAKDRHKPIITRSWSTNEPHLRLLFSLGFMIVMRKKDERGQGIDTVYLQWTPLEERKEPSKFDSKDDIDIRKEMSYDAYEII